LENSSDGIFLLHISFSQPENVPKNRYENSLPYDHARVVLNELANANGSDYINASSIVSSKTNNV